MKLFFNLIIALSLLSISSYATSKDTSKVKTISLDMEQMKDFTADELFESYSVTQLESNDSIFLKDISSMVVYKNLLFFLYGNPGEIIWFNDQGNYINRLNKIGSKPDEYPCITRFYINQYNGNIETTDERTFSSYNQQCELLERKDIYAETGRILHEISRVDSDRIAFISRLEKSTGYIYSLSQNKIVQREELYQGYQVLQGDGLIKHTSSKDYVTTQRGCLVLSMDKEGFHTSGDFDLGEDQIDFKDSSYINRYNEAETPEEKIDLYFNLMKESMSGFLNHCENDLFVIRTFVYKGKRVAFIYNKKNKEYKMISGPWAKLLYESKLYLKEDELTMCSNDFTIDDLNQSAVAILKQRKPNDNPLIFKFILKK